MKKKIIAALLILSAGVMLLSGCKEKADRGSYYPYDLSEYVKLGNYKKVKYTPKLAEITNEEVEEKIKANMEKAELSTQSEKTSPAQNGDIANIDYVGYLNGKAFEGGTASGYALRLGSNSFIEGFEEGVVGSRAGDKLKLNLTFPENYHAEEFAGKKVVFEVTVNRVYEITYPELTDAVASKLSSGKTAKEYKTSIYNTLLEEKTEQVEDENKNSLISAVIDCCEIKRYPRKEVKNYQNKLKKQYESTAQNQGVSFETFLSYNGLTEEKFDTLLEENAKNLVAKEMVFTLIAEKEKITVSNEEFESSLESYAKQNYYQYPEDFLRAVGKDTFRGMITVDKAITYVEKQLTNK